MITNETVKAIEAVQKERLDLTLKKNADYSGIVDNIGLCGLEGIALRIFDKACRLLAISRNTHQLHITDEKIEDTLKDLANYADYGVVLERGQWKA